MIKVILAEDHHLVRQGIRSLLERVNDIEILAEAENGEVVVEFAARYGRQLIRRDQARLDLDETQYGEKRSSAGVIGIDDEYFVPITPGALTHHR